MRTLVLGAVLVIAAMAIGAAVFTTFDHVAVAEGDCGSPLDPVDGAPPACGQELGHARATRTAALAWAVVVLGAGWAGESLTGDRRRAG